MKKVSVIVPCYNESSSLSQLYAALRELMDSQSQYDWEILMVNDGSQDNTLQVIKELRQQDPRVCYIDLSRNCFSASMQRRSSRRKSPTLVSTSVSAIFCRIL